MILIIYHRSVNNRKEVWENINRKAERRWLLTIQIKENERERDNDNQSLRAQDEKSW